MCVTLINEKRDLQVQREKEYMGGFRGRIGKGEVM